MARRKYIIYRKFRNASGSANVLQIRGQVYYPGTIHMKLTGKASQSGFSRGQAVTYQNGSTVISGNISDIFDNLNNENPTGSEYTIVLPYSGPSIAIMGGGSVYATPDSSGTVNQSGVDYSYFGTSEDNQGLITPSTQPMTSKPVTEAGFNPLLLIGLGVGAYFLLKIAK